MPRPLFVVRSNLSAPTPQCLFELDSSNRHSFGDEPPSASLLDDISRVREWCTVNLEAGKWDMSATRTVVEDLNVLNDRLQQSGTFNTTYDVIVDVRGAPNISAFEQRWC